MTEHEPIKESVKDRVFASARSALESEGINFKTSSVEASCRSINKQSFLKYLKEFRTLAPLIVQLPNLPIETIEAFLAQDKTIKSFKNQIKTETQDQIRLLDDENQKSAEAITDLKNKLADTEENLKKRENQVQQLNDQLAQKDLEFAKAVSDHENELKRIHDSFDQQSLHQKALFDEKMVSQLEKLTTSKKELDAANKTIENLEIDLANNKAENALLNKKSEKSKLLLVEGENELKLTKATFAERETSLQKQLADKSQQLADAKKDANNLRDKLSSLTEIKATLSATIDKLQSELDLLNKPQVMQSIEQYLQENHSSFEGCAEEYSDFKKSFTPELKFLLGKIKF